MSAYNPYFTESHGGGRPRITFSRTEVLHLAVAVVVLTAAFAFVLNDVGVDANPLERALAPPILYLASFMAVGSGFVLHELAHKILAQRYGHWAEFRGQFSSLLISLAIALGLGFLFAAPGAVMIWGRVTAKENGLISLMGPAVNFIIALIALPFTFVTNINDPLPYTMAVVAFVNSLLCVFNLLPILNLDGRKVWYWNRGVYVLAAVLAVGLFVLLGVMGRWPL